MMDKPTKEKLAFRAIRRGTIRTRLVLSFTLLSLLLVVAVTGASMWVSWQSGQRQVANQLESTATLKEREIQAWLTSLKTDMALLVSGERPVEDAWTLLRTASQFGSYEYARQDLETRFQAFMKQSGRFKEMFLLNSAGQVILSTDAGRQGQIDRDIAYYREGLSEPVVSVPFSSPTSGQTTIVATQPLLDDKGKIIGVLAARADASQLSAIMAERAGMGRTGETYLVQGGLLLTPTRAEEQGPVFTAGSRAAILGQTNGSASYANYAGRPVIGAYHWIPELKAALMAEQEQADTLQAIQSILLTNLAVALAAVVLAIGASLIVARSIANPLAGLAGTARRVAAGDLALRAEVQRQDEVGTLAQAFNQMTDQLRDLIAGLEQRVAARTADLEDRSRYLRAAAEVSRSATSILDATELIQQSVDLIRDRFGLYYVGLFLLDDTGEWAVLRAGTGDAGQILLARGHRIQVAPTPAGMVGWSVANAAPRVALQAGEDAIRLATPELPETRSEAALPLRSRGRVLGALTVQSAHPAAFDPDTLAVLETMADQVAVALDNARLFSETQSALEATRRAYGEISRQEWARLVQAQPDLAFRSDEQGVSTTRAELWRPEIEQAVRTGRTIHTHAAPIPGDGQTPGVQSHPEEGSIAVPIKVRGDVIGVLRSRRAIPWSAAEIAMLESIAEQLGLALESARLYHDTQRRAAQEQLVGEVTSRMRETLDVEKVLQTAVREIGQALELHDLTIRLKPDRISTAAQRGGR